jgi:hypothetical protein
MSNCQKSTPDKFERAKLRTIRKTVGEMKGKNGKLPRAVGKEVMATWTPQRNTDLGLVGGTRVGELAR